MLMKDAKKLIKLLEKVSGKKVILKENDLLNISSFFRDVNKKQPKIGDFIKDEDNNIGVVKSFFTQENKYTSNENRMLVDFNSHYLELNPTSAFEIVELSEKNLLEKHLSREAVARMRGLVNLKDLNILEIKLRIITSDWLNEGFEKEDVKEYINSLIDTI